MSLLCIHIMVCMCGGLQSASSKFIFLQQYDIKMVELCMVWFYLLAENLCSWLSVRALQWPTLDLHSLIHMHCASVHDTSSTLRWISPIFFSTSPSTKWRKEKKTRKRRDSLKMNIFTHSPWRCWMLVNVCVSNELEPRRISTLYLPIFLLIIFLLKFYNIIIQMKSIMQMSRCGLS